VKKHKKDDMPDGFIRNPMRQIEDELKAILPVVEQVRELHRKGRYGFDICPQNIVMSPKGAVLRVKNIQLNAGGTIAPCPELAAPEWYTGGDVGPWSDVYAVSAMVYHAITGRKLPPSFERSPGETLFDGLVQKYQSLADAISGGVELDISKRIPSLDMLFVQIQSCLIKITPAPAAAKHGAKTEKSQASFISDAAHERLRRKKRIVLWSVVLGVLLLGGAWLVNAVNYTQAVSHVESGAYEKAQRSLKGVFAFYGDAKQLSLYTEAGMRLKDGEYEAASRLFFELGNYRNASEMVSETAYRHAQYLMQKGSYSEAEALLDTIFDYKDAAQMRTEIAYLNACAYMDAGLYVSALEVFKTINSYNDTPVRIDEAKLKLYELALSAMKAGDTETAASRFEAIPGYEQSDVYAIGCSLLIRAQSGDAFTQEDYHAFLRLADITDLTPYLTCDTLITHYLCGSWQDEKENLFIMDSNGGIQYNLPGIDGGTYMFKDGILYMSPKDSAETPMFGFSCIDLNTVALYCYEDGMTYNMTRQ